MIRMTCYWLALLSLVWPCAAASQPSLADYANARSVRSAEISNSGDMIAFIALIGETEALCLYDLRVDENKCVLNVTDVKAGNISFAGENHITMIASKTTRQIGYRNKFEFSAAFSYNLKSGRVKQLLIRTDGLHPAQSGLGSVLAVSEDGDDVYMPAYMGYNDRALYSLLKVDTDHGGGRAVEDGTRHTIDWFVKPNGSVLAREEFKEKDRLHRILAKHGNDWEEIYSDEAEYPDLSVLGMTADYENLVVVSGVEDSDFNALYLMNLETGAISEPMFHKDGHEITRVLADENRIVYGVEYSGMLPSYAFFDEKLDADIADLVDSASMTSITISSWSDDWSKVLLYTTNSNTSGIYSVLDRTTGTSTGIAETRPNIRAEHLGVSAIIEYKARDGLTIPAIYTWPTGVKAMSDAKPPLIVLPHGGPASYDSVGFDWMAQFFANRGYAVLQPNFRGSTGFGWEFQEAGKGEWGRAMQDDVTDGLDAVIASGWADPDRVCIVGWSYGGYAALAGGAFTPDKYNCVVSIAGVSDLPRMLLDERRRFGSSHPVYAYWQDYIGNEKEQRDELEAVSPAYHADKFKAPVLLIHGRDDTIVDDRQSDVMRDELKKAGKPVELIFMKDQDHSLSTQSARIEAMTEVIKFVDAHINTRPAQTATTE